MSEIITGMIVNTALDFAAVARKVNAASKKRKAHALAAQRLVEKSARAARELEKKMRRVAKSNFAQRNRNAVVLNYCSVLQENVRAQERIIASLRANPAIDQDLLAVFDKARAEIALALEDVLPLLDRIIANDNEIILMDSILLKKKSLELESLKQLGKLVARSLSDSQKAIDGSASNLVRGRQLSRNMKTLRTRLRRNDRTGIRELAREAKRGWQIASGVNTSSMTQALFADSVRQFTSALAHDAREVGELVMRKHTCFESNLQEITVLIISLTVGMKPYLEIAGKADLLREMPGADDLCAYVRCACADLAYITALNYDMTGIIAKNNQVENSTIVSTRKETEYFDRIMGDIQSMTEVTKYPVEGSSRNIDNGRLMESALLQLLA